MSLTMTNTAVTLLTSKKSNHRRRHCFSVGVLPSEKPKVWSLQLQPTTTGDKDKTITVDGDKIIMGITDEYQHSKKKEFNNFKDEPHHLLIAQKSSSFQSLSIGFTLSELYCSSQSISQGFSSYEHGTINIAYRWKDFICVGVDSKLTKHLSGEVTSLDYKKLYELSTNIYITMAGSKEPWEFMYKFIASEFSKKSEKHHTVEAAALLAHTYLMIATDAEPNLACTVGCLVLGWDFTSPDPQMFRAVAGNSLVTSQSAMALGTGEESINLQDLTDSYHKNLADASRNTMFLLSQACLSDSYCGGTAKVWVLQRDQQPSCKYVSVFN